MAEPQVVHLEAQRVVPMESKTDFERAVWMVCAMAVWTADLLGTPWAGEMADKKVGDWADWLENQ
jgi:hypothetical protein